MPLSPMYPPREERDETPAPVNEFAQHMWFGVGWLAIGVLGWLSSRNVRGIWRAVVIASGFWVNAMSLKLGWTTKKRWLATVVWVAVALAVTYLLGWWWT